MDEIRRVRPWLLGGLLLAAGIGASQIGARYVERWVALRVDAFATRIGARVQFDQPRVGLFPPLRLTGLVIDRPGQAVARIGSLTASPRLFGPAGFGLIARVSIEGARVTLPAGLEVRLMPSIWDLDPGRSLTLRSPSGGLAIAATTGAKGRVVDVKVSGLPLDQLIAFDLDDVKNGDLGLLEGEAHFEGEPQRDFQARWRFAALGAHTRGTLAVAPGSPEPGLEVSFSFADLEFARLFKALGVEAAAAEPLGSLAGEVGARGRLHDPATLEIKQEIVFTRPPRRPASVARLRGDFVQEVTTNLGALKRIDVAEGAPNFIALPDVPSLFIRALLIAEDGAFFSHPGIDLSEMPRAIAINWARGEAARGASTITQQLAKNLFLTREKSLHRKLKELSYAFLLESTLGKVRILEIYLNIIEWGPGLYGLKPAARHYFGKEPKDLTPTEVAFLVSLIPGPIKYQRSIQGDELGPGFDNLVNNLLVKLRSVDALTEEEYEAARNEKLLFRWANPDADESGTGPWIQKSLDQ